MSNNTYINTGGGNVSADNLAVGDGATIVISGNMRVEVAQELDAIRSLIESSNIPIEHKSELSNAVQTISSEAGSKTVNKSKVISALDVLDKATKTGSVMTDLGLKLAPHLAALAGVLI